MKQGIRINDADKSETCRKNEWCGASNMSPKQVHKSPESKSRSWCINGEEWCNNEVRCRDGDIRRRQKLTELSSMWCHGRWWSCASSDGRIEWSLDNGKKAQTEDGVEGIDGKHISKASMQSISIKPSDHFTNHHYTSDVHPQCGHCW